MLLKRLISVSLFSMLLSVPLVGNAKAQKVEAEELPYEIVDYIDSTGEQLIETDFKIGDYPRITYDFMLLEESSEFIGGTDLFRFYVDDNKFKLDAAGSEIGAANFAPYNRFVAITGRQSVYDGNYNTAYLDMQQSNLSFEFAIYTNSPASNEKVITLFGGKIGEEIIHAKVRLFSFSIADGPTLKPCRIKATNEYCLVNPATGAYYKDKNNISFVKDSLVRDINYVDKDGKEAVVENGNKIRPNQGVGRVSGDIYVDEDLEIKQLELQGDTNLYIYDDATLTVSEGVVEKNNGSAFKLNIFGQTKQSGKLTATGKHGATKTGKAAGRAEDGLPAIKVKTLSVFGCNLTFVGGAGGNNDSTHIGLAGYDHNKFESGDGMFASKCEQINITRGVVTFEGGAGGITSDTDIITEHPYLNGTVYGAINNKVIVNNVKYSVVGGADEASAVVLDASGVSYANNKDYMFVKIDTLTETCPYDVIVVDNGDTYPYINFDDCVQASNTFSTSFVCHLIKDIEVTYELSLGGNEIIDLHGHTLTCEGLYLTNDSDFANTSDTVGKIATKNFHWTKDGQGLFKSVKGFDGNYYIVSTNFAVVEKITYSWDGTTCIAHANHVGLTDSKELTSIGVYVKDTDATYQANEKGHYEATFEAPFVKQSTAPNSIEKEGTVLPTEDPPVEENPPVEEDTHTEEQPKAGCAGSLSASSLFLFVVPVLGICLIKKNKE